MEKIKKLLKPYLDKHPQLKSTLKTLFKKTFNSKSSAVVTQFDKKFTPENSGKVVSVVSQHWDRLADENFTKDMERRAWGGIPQIHANHNYLITGDRNYYWITYIKDRYFKGGFAGDTLSLGCGEGHVDRIFKDCGFQFNSFTGVDISPKSIERAQELAAQNKLSPKTHYFVGDLNQFELEKNSYDFIYFFQSLHHVEAMETLLASCVNALRPNGLLMVNEFVGPSRFQWTEKQVKMANHLLQLLPEDLRFDLLHTDGRIKNKVLCPTVEEMIQGDPSEAVRSAEIEKVLKTYFDVIEEKNWGGTLNYLIFENIAGNFNEKNSYHLSIIELLIHHENALIENGILESDFKFYIAKPKTSSLSA